jgi:hypothetical protein
MLLSNGYHVLLSGVSTHALPSNGLRIVAHSFAVGTQQFALCCLSTSLGNGLFLFRCQGIPSRWAAMDVLQSGFPGGTPHYISVLKFSRLKFNEWQWLSGIRLVECWIFSNVLAGTEVGIRLFSFGAFENHLFARTPLFSMPNHWSTPNSHSTFRSI